MKGFVQLTVSWIIAVILVVLALTFAFIQIHHSNNVQREALILEINDYYIKQDLNQFLSTEITLDNREYIVADLFIIYPYDDTIESKLKNIIQEYYGEGNIYKKKYDGHTVFIVAAVDRKTREALDMAWNQARNQVNDNQVFDTEGDYPVEALLISGYFNSILTDKVEKAKVANAGDRGFYQVDDSLSSHAVNLMSLDGGITTVMLIKYV